MLDNSSSNSSSNIGRGVSALHRRAQQLKLWHEREELLAKNEHLTSPANRKNGAKNRTTTIATNGSTIAAGKRIKFSDKTLFLAASTSDDYDECERLLAAGSVDIDDANVDGLTALHHACIDDNLDMVRFLILHGADVDRADNEGWRPLHASASCGHSSIVRALLEAGADPRWVNNDEELALDIADNEEVADLLADALKEMEVKDFEVLRKQEEIAMMEDVEDWVKRGKFEDEVHPRTGATILHVAAAKGYNGILDKLLHSRSLRGQIEVNAVDFEGWTPLHAACYFQQPGSVELLLQSGADPDSRTANGLTLNDLTDHELILKLVETRRAKKMEQERKLKEQEAKLAELERKLKDDEKEKRNGHPPVPTSPISPPAGPLVESETQRKAHAKRARETRRSTQGISADDVNKARDQLKMTAAAITSSSSSSTEELRAKDNMDGDWKEKKDKPPFILKIPITPNSLPLTSTVSPITSTVTSLATTTTSSSAGEHSSPDSQVTDLTNINLTRRRRPKRRSTGTNPYESAQNDEVSIKDDPVPIRSRSTSRQATAENEVRDEGGREEKNKVKDYEKLYEDLVKEFEVYRREIAEKEQEWNRERRRIHRKMSEMEEECKQLEQFRTDNQRLKDENGALVRVISKLSK